MSTKRARSPRGFTLVESIMFLVIVSVGVVGILNLLNVTASTSVDPVRRKQAQMIAESLMEEVLLARMTFCDPASTNWDRAVSTANCTAVGAVAEEWGPESGNERPYDNVNDYGASGGAAVARFNNGSGQLVDANGNQLPAGYAATVAIAPLQLDDIAQTDASANNDALQITVTVSYDNTSLALVGYRTRYAPNDR
jgi:MSHA pilin protein MshD